MNIAGIKIAIHWSWFIAFGIITWSLSTAYYPKALLQISVGEAWLTGIVTSLFIFGSVFLHELAHTFVARREGLKAKKITFMIFGGVAEFKGEPKTPLSEFKMIIAGPLMNFFIASVLFFMDDPVSNYLMITNLMIGGFNLIPAFPLDGGKLLRAGLWHVKKDYIRASEIAATFGSWFSLLLIFVGVFFIFMKVLSWGIWLLMIGGFIRIISDGYMKDLKGVSSLRHRVSEVMIPESSVIKVGEETTVGEFFRDYFLRYGYHGFPVVDKEGKVKGMITYWFLRKEIKGGNIHEDMKISEIMMKFEDLKPLLISSDNSLSEALSKMLQNSANRLCVTDHGGRFKGLLTIATIKRYANFSKEEE